MLFSRIIAEIQKEDLGINYKANGFLKMNENIFIEIEVELKPHTKNPKTFNF